MGPKNETTKLITRSFIIWVFIISIPVFFIVQLETLYNVLTKSDQYSKELVENQISSRVDGLLKTVDAFSFTPSFVTFLLWMLLGIIVYLLFTNFLRKSHELMDDFKIATLYVHPKQFRQASFWSYILVTTLFSLLVISFLIAWTIICFRYVFPFSQLNFFTAIDTNTALLSIVVYIALSYSTILLAIFGYAVGIKLLKTHIV